MRNKEEVNENITPFKLHWIKRMLQYGDIRRIADHFGVSERKIQYDLKADSINENNRPTIQFAIKMLKDREKKNEKTFAEANKIMRKK